MCYYSRHTHTHIQLHHGIVYFYVSRGTRRNFTVGTQSSIRRSGKCIRARSLYKIIATESGTRNLFAIPTRITLNSLRLERSYQFVDTACQCFARWKETEELCKESSVRDTRLQSALFSRRFARKQSELGANFCIGFSFFFFETHLVTHIRSPCASFSN